LTVKRIEKMKEGGRGEKLQRRDPNYLNDFFYWSRGRGG